MDFLSVFSMNLTFYLFLVILAVKIKFFIDSGKMNCLGGKKAFALFVLPLNAFSRTYLHLFCILSYTYLLIYLIIFFYCCYSYFILFYFIFFFSFFFSCIAET